MQDSTNHRPRKNADLLYELGTLRCIPRAWIQFHIPDSASVAEHIFRVQLTALLIAKMEGINDEAVLGRISMMALSHDLAESRTGDVAYVAREYTKRDEQMAAKDMFEDTPLGDLFLPLIEDSMKRESIEAKIVKDADNLDVDLELREMELKGQKHLETFMVTRKYVRAERLYTESAKKLWDEIHSTNPSDWIMIVRNRMNNGDWKPTK